MPYAHNGVVKDKIEKMLQEEVIQPSTSPRAFPIILVRKKDGLMTFCIDFRKLSAIAKFDAYPMPRIDKAFECIGPTVVISMLNLAKGYWQISLSPLAKEKTAFTTFYQLVQVPSHSIWTTQHPGDV